MTLIINTINHFYNVSKCILNSLGVVLWIKLFLFTVLYSLPLLFSLLGQCYSIWFPLASLKSPYCSNISVVCGIQIIIIFFFTKTFFIPHIFWTEIVQTLICRGMVGFPLWEKLGCSRWPINFRSN